MKQRKRQVKVREIDPHKLIGITEAAKMTGLSKHIIKKLCEKGEIEAYRILDLWKMTRISVIKFMDQQNNQNG